MLPTLNEEKALAALAPEIPGEFDVLVVDGGSTDRTREVAKELGYGCIVQKFGKGKGCGVRSAMEYFLNTDYRYLAMIDADYTCDPAKLIGMYGRLIDNGYDIVLGNRDRKQQRDMLGWFSLFINASTSSIVTYAYGMDLPDIQSCYWLFSRKAVEVLYPHLTARGFEIEYDIVYNSWLYGLNIGHYPVTIRKRVGDTKFTNYLRLKQIYFGLVYVYKSLCIMFGRKFAFGDGRKRRA